MLTVNAITLREFRETDLPFVIATRHDLEIETAAHPSTPVPRSIHVLHQRLREGHLAVSSGSADSVEFIITPVDEPETPIGIGGLYAIDRHNGTAEVGVTISDRAHWGTGAGFDAHLALLDYGFEFCRLQRIYGQVKADNVGVVKLCHRLGMTQEGTLRRHRWKPGGHVDLIIFGILVQEYDRSLANWREQRSESPDAEPGVPT